MFKEGTKFINWDEGLKIYEVSECNYEKNCVYLVELFKDGAERDYGWMSCDKIKKLIKLKYIEIDLYKEPKFIQKLYENKIERDLT